MDTIDLDKIENKKELQLYLKRIKPFSKFKENEDVPLEYLEKLIKTICIKYSLRISNIGCDTSSNKKHIVWVISVWLRNSSYKYIYSLSIYELLAKTCIYLYEKVKEHKK